MSAYPQPGLHPDADSLSAFIEGVLPEQERLRCLAHLAECPSCREVVYLAQEPGASQPVPADVVKGRWFRPIPVFGFAALVGILVLSVWFYQRGRSTPREPELVAMAPKIVESSPSPEMEMKPSKAAAPALRAKAVAPPLVAPSVVPSVSAPPAKDTVSVTAESAAVQVSSAPLPSAPAASPADLPVRALPSAPPPPRQLLQAAKPAPPPAPVKMAGITGTVTDSSGAAIPGATVKLRPVASAAIRSLTSDPDGQFNVAGLEAGRYELQISKPGFRQFTEQVDVQPSEMVRADSTLSIGSVSESISVTAGTPAIQLSTSSVASKKVRTIVVEPLPSKLPAETTVVNGKVTLALDSAGALFVSQNAGKKWSAVKPVWNGKVVAVSSADPAFQLTTDSGAIWLSRDGSHWYSAASQK
jgi:hypothetical protein